MTQVGSMGINADRLLELPGRKALYLPGLSDRQLEDGCFWKPQRGEPKKKAGVGGTQG